MEKLARIYINEVVAMHGVPMSIISNRDGRFTSQFWQTLQKALGTRLDMSTTYYPQTDGHSECTIYTLEDMLRACVIDFGGSWDTHLPSVEFFYNNTYHLKVGESQMIGLEIVQETTQKNISNQGEDQGNKRSLKSYADNRCKPLEFSIGDQVLLKVSPLKGVVRFGKKGKLAPSYVGPFEIIERTGPVAY
ncbi:putative reverse transcriptase domain-containing protein [Tanacetum coccineum]